MKPKYFLFLMLSLSLLIGCSRTTEPELPYAMELEDVLDQTRQSTNVMGISVAIIVPGYHPWLGVSGESHPGQPITKDMLFDMASAGKLIMSALVLDICEEGLLSLKDPISKYLPEFPNVDGSITVRQLLNHTSGLYDMVPHPEGPFRKPYNSIDFEKWWTIDEIFTKLGGEPYFSPGDGFHYTQAGFQRSPNRRCRRRSRNACWILWVLTACCWISQNRSPIGLQLPIPGSTQMPMARLKMSFQNPGTG